MSLHCSGYGLDSPGFKSQQVQEMFFFSIMSRMAQGSIQPPTQSVRGGALSRG